MNRLAIKPHCAGAAITSVAAFFDSEPSQIAKESPQALPWLRPLRKDFAVDLATHQRA
jgi:hypothetical protein